MNKDAIATLIEQIRSVSHAQPDPSAFIQSLQTELEELPGAYVSFVTRDAKYLETYGYLEDVGPVPDKADLQSMIVTASQKMSSGGENYAVSDQITYFLDEEIDRSRGVVHDDDVTPG